SERVLALLAAVPGDAEISRDGEHPRDQRETAVVAGEGLEDLQEDLLRELLRVLPLQREVISDPRDPLTEPIPHVPPGIVGAPAGGRGQGLFVGSGGSHPCLKGKRRRRGQKGRGEGRERGAAKTLEPKRLKPAKGWGSGLFGEGGRTQQLVTELGDHEVGRPV